MIRIHFGIALASLFALAAPAAARQQPASGTAPAAFAENPPAFQGEVETTGRVNVRLKPGSGDDSPVTDVLKDGAQVHVVGKEGSWYAIVPPKGSVGCWIHAGNVKVNGERATVVKDQAPVRFDSRHNADVMAKLPKGTELQIRKTHLGWHQIVEPPGVHYYVHAKYIKNKGEAPAATTVGNLEGAAAKVQAIFEEAREKTRVAMTSTDHNFTVPISLYQKAEGMTQDATLKKEAQEQILFLTELQQIFTRASGDNEKILELERALKDVQTRTEIAILKARKDVEAAAAAALARSIPRYTHWGYLESTPHHLSHHGMFCLVDKLEGGKRTAFIDVNDITRRNLNNMYRQFIKINGTETGKDAGVPVLKLDLAAYADPSEATTSDK